VADDEEQVYQQHQQNLQDKVIENRTSCVLPEAGQEMVHCKKGQRF
jgi:hypothetical protein